MKLAMVQMLIQPGDKEANLARAERWIVDAASQGAEVVVLPEALPFGWTHPSARDQADEIPDGASCGRLCRAARNNGLFVCSGMIERAGDKIFNAAVLIDPKGDVLIHHRKIYELEIAHDLYSRGDRLSVTRTTFGAVGVMICADAFAPGLVIGRTLALMGAKIILSPCAWAVAADHDNVREPYGRLWLESYGAIARESGVLIAGVSNVGPIVAGPWLGRKCIGNSLLIGPDGEELARGPYGEQAEALLLCDV